MSAPDQILVDDQTLKFCPGETILDATRRAGCSLPTLCHDPRLEPVGACRSCLVEVKGQRRLMPACKTPASPGMQIETRNERVLRHQRVLLSLYLSDHVGDPSECEDGAPCELHALAKDLGNLPVLVPLQRKHKPRADRNPFIEFRSERCIACARCVRYCDEVEGVNAITLTGRGLHTTISTASGISLYDSTCELCGGCVDVCPTGAMAEKMPLSAGAAPERELEKVRTTCNYCGVGCQMDLNVDRAAAAGRGQVVKVTSPPAGTAPSDGNLCVKGRFAYDFIDHPDRLSTPLLRGADGNLHPASWEAALERTAAGLQEVAKKHGADALAFVSSARCTMEENYLVQKLSRAVFGTNNVHQCAAT
ncbi:MAG TPA: 4Fe-4S dicluster domain-containing protein [Planctomycetes bacterium]|nr:4Fe-4S dicluster domain-containing protein [Planctomycetota bacterium]HIL52753.1 4Fe-4S dicluster domain-containing protein [Planctomycetota bacterium]